MGLRTDSIANISGGPDGPTGATGPTGPTGPVGEAPNDSMLYARQNSNWTQVPVPEIGVTIDGASQGAYSTINYFTTSGTSSGNNIYLG